MIPLRSRSSRRGAAVAAFGALAVLLGATQARAFCREVTVAAPAGYNPVEQGCFSNNPDGGGALPPLFWRNQCVGYSLQRNASNQVSLATAELVAAQAFTAWSGVSCPGGGSPSITTSELPPVDCDVVPSQGHNNVIMFRDDGWPYDDSANALGYTTLTVCIRPPCFGDPDALPGEILGADTEINSSNYLIVTSGVPDGGAYDLATILTHEAGHFLGLAHSQEATAVMYAFYHPGSTVLQPDDVAGICAIYPPDGSRSTENGLASATSCDPTPLLGFEDECGSMDASAPGTGAEADDEGGDAAPTTQDDTLFGCAMGRPPRSVGGWLAPLAVVALGWLIRGRRPLRRHGPTVAACGFALAALGGPTGATHDARASVSIVVELGDLVKRSSAVAVVTPNEQHALWEDDRIVTYTKARVDRLIAGRLAADVWIRTLGGRVGNIGQLLEGQATFALGSPSLVFLHPHLDPHTHAFSGAFGVVEGAQGQFPVSREGGQPRLTIAENVGALVPPVSGNVVRPAREALRDRAVDDAAHEIAATWARAH